LFEALHSAPVRPRLTMPNMSRNYRNYGARRGITAAKSARSNELKSVMRRASPCQFSKNGRRGVFKAIPRPSVRPRRSMPTTGAGFTVIMEPAVATRWLHQRAPLVYIRDAQSLSVPVFWKRRAGLFEALHSAPVRPRLTMPNMSRNYRNYGARRGITAATSAGSIN